MTPAQIRKFLISREAVLVHFSTVMASDPSRVFPNDLKNAMTLRGVGLGFSTIQKGDRFDPTNEGKGGAEGGIGVLADIASTTQVLKVHSSDMGSFCDNSGNADGMGAPPTPESCARSIDDRVRSNEWLVKDYESIGVFVLRPLLVRVPIPDTNPVAYAEAEVDLDPLVKCIFPNLRIFTANDETYLEFDRAVAGWKRVGIHDIYP